LKERCAATEYEVYVPDELPGSDDGNEGDVRSAQAKLASVVDDEKMGFLWQDELVSAAAMAEPTKAEMQMQMILPHERAQVQKEEHSVLMASPEL
jgi:hypothetical protein